MNAEPLNSPETSDNNPNATGEEESGVALFSAWYVRCHFVAIVCIFITAPMFEFFLYISFLFTLGCPALFIVLEVYENKIPNRAYIAIAEIVLAVGNILIAYLIMMI